jgi:Tol biopolymer transport system component
MPLSAGTRLGPYEIVAPLGAGGMGEVYKATDTRLGRAVAVKVLPAHVASNSDLKARFEREARTISSLNHPHICTLHDIGRDGDTDFLVMEYLEGETLADKINRGPLPVRDALHIGGEIADALDKAHRQGVVHRDLKPGNVMLTKVGSKLLDFGLAKLHPNSAIGLSGTPTVTTPLTNAGTIVGTYQYMAPEQLEGHEADARTDIFAFGVLLYEMVTGRRPFTGATQASVIAAILKDVPASPSGLEPLSPPALDGIIVTCLAKAPDDRWQSAGDVGRQLKLLQSGLGSPSATAVGTSSLASGASAAALRRGQTVSKRRRLAMAAAAFAVAVALVGLAVFRDGRGQDTREPVRFTLATTGTLDPTSVAVSPDGRYLAYVVSQLGEPSRLYVRPIDALEARLIPGTDGAIGPFWSADSHHVGFVAQGQLKRVALAGGSPQTLASVGSSGFGGGTWNANGDILFSGGPGSPIRRVSAAGGEPVDVTKLEGPMAGTAHVYPSFLPDGRRFLFARIATLAAGGQALYVGSLDSSPPAMVVQGASRGAYAPQGYLLFERERVVVAQRFDLDRLTVNGEPMRVADGLTAVPPVLIGAFSVSNTGVLSYVTGGSGALAGPQVPLSRLTWYDRSGRAVGSIGEPGRYAGVSLSPDGRRVAVHRHEDESGGIWIYDLQRNTWSQFTFDREHNIAPLWSPDGQFVVFTSLSRGSIYRKLASGTGPEEALPKTPDFAVAETWSPDGKTLLIGGMDTVSLAE